MIAETNVFDPEIALSREQGGYGFDAMWSDCFLQSVFAVLRPGEQLTNRVYTGSDLSQVRELGYVYEGTLRSERKRVDVTNNRKMVDRPDMHALIYAIQHHNSIGNHPLGKRLHQLAGIHAQRP